MKNQHPLICRIANLAATLTIAQFAAAQPALQWQRSVGGTAQDNGNAIIQTSDGGYAMAGFTKSNNGDASGHHGLGDAWVVKISNTGTLQWQKCLGGTGEDQAFSIQQTADGGYITAGYTGSNNGDVHGYHGSRDAWVVKLDGTGTIQWQKCLGGSNYDEAYSVVQTNDGGYVVAGYTASNDGDASGLHGMYDAWVVKLSGTGSIQWQQCLGGTGQDWAYAIRQTADGGYVLAANTNSTDGDVSGNHGNWDAWVLKLSATGALQWQKCLGGTAEEKAYAILQAADGGYAVAGYTESNNGDVSGYHGSRDAWVIKLNGTGTLQWQKCLGGTNFDEALSLLQTADGGYAMAGYSGSNDGDVSGNHGSYDNWAVRLDGTGGLLWQKCFGGTGSDYAYAMQQTTGGGYIMAASTQSNNGDVSGNHGGWDAWVTKLDCGNEVTVSISTDSNPSELSWEIRDSGNALVASGAPSVANGINSSTTCLGGPIAGACYSFKLMDSFGDGITGGGWELRTASGKLLLRDEFASGSQSPSATPQTPSYGSGHSFCLPAGPSQIMANECGVFTNGMYDKVYCSMVTGATQYQFEFSNPDAGYMRRIARPHNYVVFYEMVSSPLVPGVKYFTRVRTNEAGPLASAHFGAGCELGLGIAQVVQCTQLIEAPAYGHSCNETRSFNAPYNYLYAKPVTGATTYTFKITGNDGNYNSGIEFVRSTYILSLDWGIGEAPALVDLTTYQVQVRVTVNGIEGTYCGNTCNVTIDNNPGLRPRMVQGDDKPELSLWPNPSNGQHLNVAMGGLDSELTTADVRLMDVTGRVAVGTQLYVVDGVINSMIELGDAANGTYLLQIIAGDKTWTKRVVVSK